MRRFFVALVGTISLVLGSVAITHYVADTTTVEAGNDC